MESRPPAPHGREDATQALVEALQGCGLEARVYHDGATTCIHVSPPAAPTAGTDLRLATHGGHRCFFSEWGASIGCQTDIVARRVTWWFGKSSPRP